MIARATVVLIWVSLGLGVVELLPGSGQKAGTTGPEAVEDVIQHYGFITVNGTWFNSSHVFFWMFESRSRPSTDPLILWLTGGTFCSIEEKLANNVLQDLDAQENGPYRIEKNLTLSLNPYSWNSFANIIYVDAPVGTGYSYPDSILGYPTDEAQIAEELYIFMQNFLARYPKYKEQDFYILGESYAGHNMPPLAQRILTGNSNSNNFCIKLKGIGIGNGWVNPYLQYPTYADFAYGNGFLTTSQYERAKEAGQTCQALINDSAYIPGLWAVAFAKCEADNSEVITQVSKKLGYPVSPFNWKQSCPSPPQCFDFDPISKYLQQPQVQEKLGVIGRDWTACSAEVFVLLIRDSITSVESYIPPLLASGIQVFVYTGVLDFVCNWVGGDEWIRLLQWPGAPEFNKMNYTDWHVDGKLAGMQKSYGGLTFLKVLAAGHMVAVDQPAVALAVLKDFLT